MKTMIITGASGFVGKALAKKFLREGYAVIGVGTSAAHPYEKTQNNFQWVSADTTMPGPWQEHIARADSVINLTGRNIFQYWTEKYKKAILDSRVKTTQYIVEALPNGESTQLINASAVGIYGDCGDHVLTEASLPGNGFLADVCKAWEKAAFTAGRKGARVSVVRFGVVLGNGGALSKMMPAFKMFAGGPLGDGGHWFPWIHLADLEEAVAFVLSCDTCEGVFNFTAPGTVRQGQFAKLLGKTLNRPSVMRVPAFAIKLVMGELGASLLQSQRAVPEKLLDSGFSFRFPNADAALADILGK